jgi:hypothetical protein
MGSWRKLVVDGKNYRWRGSDFVVIQDEHGKRVGGARVTAPQIKGDDWNVWERGQWKRTSDGMMRPGEVAAFIRSAVGNARDPQ